MGDVISSHLDEAKREIITARTGEVMGEVARLYEQQYAVALFNKVRFDIEGGGGPQPQLLHRKIPLENKSIFSGSLFQYQEENKKWRNRFFFVPDSYIINYYDSKASHDKHLHPKGTINCSGYKVLTSMEQYLDLISNSLPGVKAKVGSSPFLKCPTQFPLILWHPFARHFYFCVVTEKEQQKWNAVLQDCVRHANDGLSEENKVQTPAFTDAVRLYRQANGQYGTWEMMCGVPSQILANLVMEGLLPELRELISPRLKGKLYERQKNWMLISDAVYSLVQGQCQAQYEDVVQKCEASRASLEACLRTDMDQIITSKEHVTNKIRAVVVPKAEKLLKVSIEPYIGSILDALMEPTSRGFAEVRDVFFRELVDMSKNTLNEGTKETVAQHMDRISMLAFHPVKMQSCYEKVEQLSLEGLQQRFDVSSPSVFVQRAQILMREQMDDAVYTFEQILHQSLESQASEELCKTIQRCQDRVIKKFDYDSSTVRKRFFREALLQIFIPYMLKQLTPSCASDLPHFQELIFEDFSRFILVENIFEEVVLHSVMKDIMMAVKEAAVQRRHNLYRDSIVLSNSDPSLHLLGENPSIDWAGEYKGEKEEEADDGEADDGGESQKARRMKQVVSMIQVEGGPTLPSESCLEVPGVEDIPEEGGEEEEEESSDEQQDQNAPVANAQDLTDRLKEGEAKLEQQEKDKEVKEESEGLEKKEEGQPSSKQEVSESVEKKEQEEVLENSKEVKEEELPSKKEASESPEKKEEEELSSNQEVSENSEVKEEEELPSKKEASESPEKKEEPSSNQEVLENSKEVKEEELPSKKEASESPEKKEEPSSNQEVLENSKEVKEEELPSKKEASESPEKEQEKEASEGSKEEVSKGEELPLPPPPEEVPSGSTGAAPGSPPEAASDLPPPPHDDSGFQSPTDEGAEPESTSANAGSSDSEAREQ